MRTSLGTTTVLLLAVFALAGCASTPEATVPSAGDPPSATATTPAEHSSTPTPDPPASSEQSLEAIAAAAGVEDFARSAEAAPAVIAWGKGTLAGKEVRVYEFADEAGYDAFLKSIAGYGVTEDALVQVRNFAVAPNDVDQIAQIRAALQ